MQGARPLGLVLNQTSKSVARAFDKALETAGGSLPIWLILLELANKDYETQGEVAEAVGVRGPTLTHHLDKMERDGLILRARLPENRRTQHIALTEAGRTLFAGLRNAAVSFDQKLQKGFAGAETDQLRLLLARLAENVKDA